MDKQTERHLLDLADALPPLYVPRPDPAPGPPPPSELEPVPEPAKLLGQTTEGVPVLVPMAPVPPLPVPDASPPPPLPFSPPLSPPESGSASSSQWYTPVPSGTAPADVVPGLAPPTRHSRARHLPVRHRRRIVLAGVLASLVVLAAVMILLATHSLRYSSHASAPAAPASSPVPAASSASPPAGSVSPALRSSLADVPGVPAVFAACVAFTASGDGTASHNIYGITPSSGINVTGYSPAQQKAAFAVLYKRYGPRPWKSYRCPV